MLNLIASLIVAAWLLAIAIISVQNFAPVSLKFLFFQSVQVPFGIVLAFSVAIGVVGTAIAQLLWSLTSGNGSDTATRPRDRRATAEGDDALSGDW